jgi:hypothetical protein
MIHPHNILCNLRAGAICQLCQPQKMDNGNSANKGKWPVAVDLVQSRSISRSWPHNRKCPKGRLPVIAISFQARYLRGKIEATLKSTVLR